MHIIRDLCLIAVTDGHVSEDERAYIHSVATQLKIGPTIVEHCFNRDPELD